MPGRLARNLAWQPGSTESQSWRVFTRQRRCWAMMDSASRRLVSRNVATPGGALAYNRPLVRGLQLHELFDKESQFLSVVEDFELVDYFFAFREFHLNQCLKHLFHPIHTWNLRLSLVSFARSTCLGQHVPHLLD